MNQTSKFRHARQCPNENKEEFLVLSARAASKDWHALSDVGYHFFNGIGVRRDRSKAVQCYREAAEHGCSFAMHNLGLCYLKGRGVKKNESYAFRWLQRAARRGHSNAAVVCANMMDKKKKWKDSYRWYKKAAQSGHPEGLLGMGYSLLFGEGVRKSKVRGMAAIRKAAQQGSSGAMYNLGVMYLDGMNLKKSPRLGLHWLTKAADAGDAGAEKIIKTLK